MNECVCACVCVCVRERVCVRECVCECECECVRMQERRGSNVGGIDVLCVCELHVSGVR